MVILFLFNFLGLICGFWWVAQQRLSVCICVSVSTAHSSPSTAASSQSERKSGSVSALPLKHLLYTFLLTASFMLLSPHRWSISCLLKLLMKPCCQQEIAPFPFAPTYKESNQWRLGIHLWERERVASGTQQQQMDFDPGRTQHSIYYGNNYPGER